MTVVFIYRKDQFEDVLRYSLKGVEMYVQWDNIYVVGDVPEWWEHKSIQTEPNECIFQDVHNKYKLIDVNDDILLMADDIFITKPYKPIHYFNGKLKDRPRQGRRKEVYDNTLSVYPEINNFNTHRPIPIKRDVFRQTVDKFTEPFSHDAFCFGYPTKQAEDSKFKAEFTYEQCKDLPIFSTYNERGWLVEILEKIYEK